MLPQSLVAEFFLNVTFQCTVIVLPRTLFSYEPRNSNFISVEIKQTSFQFHQSSGT